MSMLALLLWSSFDKPSFVVKTLEVYEISNEHVVALVHWCYAELAFFGMGITTL